jgi:hypothetical protein
MKTKQRFRNAFGMGQIMAMLLVVLPTMAFILTLLIDYWSVMQEDYKLKLIANQTSMVLDSKQDLRAADLNTTLSNEINNICPKGTSLSFSAPQNAPILGQISVTISYMHNGPYFKNKTLNTQMQTYSYHDQNISITGTCR